MIAKDNNEHHATCQSKKAEKERKDLQEKVQSL